jgi:hypothetical protein
MVTADDDRGLFRRRHLFENFFEIPRRSRRKVLGSSPSVVDLNQCAQRRDRSAFNSGNYSPSGNTPMHAADEMAAQPKTSEHQSGSMEPGSRDEFDRFDERVRASVKDCQRASDQWKSVEDMQNHLLQIDRRLDHETSERRAIYYRLVATEREMKRQRSLRFAGYLVAICIGVVVGALAWQSYGEASAKQMIAGWIEQLGWTKPPPGHENTAIQSSVRRMSQAALVTQTAPDAVTPSAAVEQTVEQKLAAVRETLEQLAARQDQMEHDITKLQAVDMEILAQTPSPSAQPPATPARNPTPIAPPSSRQP